MKIGFKATQIAIAGFVVPYMAVYDPMLMMQGDPTIAGVAYITAKAILAVVLWGAAAIGYLRTPLAWWERTLTAATALLLVAAIPLTDEIGFGLAAAFFAWNEVKRRKVSPA